MGNGGLFFHVRFLLLDKETHWKLGYKGVFDRLKNSNNLDRIISVVLCLIVKLFKRLDRLEGKGNYCHR